MAERKELQRRVAEVEERHPSSPVVPSSALARSLDVAERRVAIVVTGFDLLESELSQRSDAATGAARPRAQLRDALGDGPGLWSPCAETGALEGDRTSWVAACGFAEATEGTLGGALSAAVTLEPGEEMIVPMVLAWDFPVIRFGTGRRYYRRYTEFIGRNGTNAVLLAREALERAADWSLAIDEWHAREIAGAGLPPKLAGMMINELYLLVDGQTAWTAGAVEDGEAEDFFGLIECPDYPYYDTMDLWVYAHLALAADWPPVDRGVAPPLPRHQVVQLRSGPGTRFYFSTSTPRSVRWSRTD